MGELSSIILAAAGLIVVGLMTWVVVVTNRLEKAVTRITDCLFGYTGENGMNADLKALREDVDELYDRRAGPADRRQPRQAEG